MSIDFGTSRSAWAYSVAHRAHDDIIIRIPDGSKRAGPDTLKTETAILLGGANMNEVIAFGKAANDKFVQDTEDGIHSGALFRWFKRPLCKNRGYTSIYAPKIMSEGGESLSLLKVIAASLRHFKDDALHFLSATSEMDFKANDISWVLTVPAIYDDFAKRFMREAACEAGIIDAVDSSRLKLCLEPEAACLAISLKEDPKAFHALEVGNHVMILDCGGGTVDITTHKVHSLTPLELSEVLPATGGAWGSTMVDEAFKVWLANFLGEVLFKRIKHSAALQSILMEWEEGKIGFTGHDAEGVRINLVKVDRCLDESDIEVRWK